jgi:hypothetical protein
MLAQVGTAALGHAIHTWVADPSGDIDTLIVQAFTDLRDFSGVEIAPEPATRRQKHGTGSLPVQPNRQCCVSSCTRAESAPGPCETPYRRLFPPPARVAFDQLAALNEPWPSGRPDAARRAM